MTPIHGISVVIPNYNGMQLLPLILPTVITSLGNVDLPSEIIVTDDHSTDASLELLAQQFPAVIIVESAVNTGFSANANRGIRAAKYSWALLLNSDVKLEPDYFSPLLQYMDRPQLFGVMGRIIGWEDERIQDGAKYPYFHGVKIKTSGNYLLVDEAAMRGGIASMYLSGANAFINKTIFERIGGFNEMFSPFYVEDYELSLRAWRLGYTCLYEHQAICRHRTSHTIGNSQKRNRVRMIYNRNKMFLHAIHLDPARRLVWFGQLGIEAIFQALTGHWFFVRGLTSFLKNYAGVKKSRQILNRLAGGGKLCSIKEIAGEMISSIGNKPVARF